MFLHTGSIWLFASPLNQGNVSFKQETEGRITRLCRSHACADMFPSCFCRHGLILMHDLHYQGHRHCMWSDIAQDFWGKTEVDVCGMQLFCYLPLVTCLEAESIHIPRKQTMLVRANMWCGFMGWFGLRVLAQGTNSGAGTELCAVWKSGKCSGEVPVAEFSTHPDSLSEICILFQQMLMGLAEVCFYTWAAPWLMSWQGFMRPQLFLKRNGHLVWRTNMRPLQSRHWDLRVKHYRASFHMRTCQSSTCLWC